MRALAALATFAVLALTPSAFGVTHVVGGAPLDVRNAPWAVLVLHRAGGVGTLCSGSILDALHVLTAAHCVTENGSTVSAASLTVRAGVTNAASPLSTDVPQNRPVESLRVHRGYVPGDRVGGDDAALLTLASPLDLNESTARAIALPTPGLRLKIGDPVTLAGFGLKVVGGSIDGTLNGMNGTIVDQTDCLRAPYDTANAVLLCAFSGSSSPCGGDSGSGLVVMTPSPVLVGVTRAATCNGNSAASFADVTAPEILQFVQGSDDPPAAPRPVSTPTLERPTSVPQVGQTVHCTPGTWSGSPTFSYSFYEGSVHQLLSSGSSPDYVLRTADAGRTLICRAVASNAGGTGYYESAATAPVINAPELSAPGATAQRGKAAVLRVRLVDWARPLGAVTVCARLAPHVGGKACRTATLAGGSPVSLSVPVKGSAPVVRVRVLLTAQATDGRVARSIQYVTVVG